MTLLNFISVSTLAFGPTLLLIRGSRLSDPECTPALVRSAFFYIVAHLFKSLCIATLAPESLLQSEMFAAVLLSATSITELLVMFRLFAVTLSGRVAQRISTVGVARFWIVGSAWALCDAFPRFLSFWIGARGPAFDWKHVQSAIDANASLLYLVALAAAMQMRVATTTAKASARSASSGKQGCAVATWKLDVLLCSALVDPFVAQLAAHDPVTILAFHIARAVLVAAAAWACWTASQRSTSSVSSRAKKQ
eukprot:ANDGO_00820.mRNA.1 hypothetical protein ACA1_370090